MKFGRKELWLSPLKQVDKNDKEEEGGDGDEDHIDDDGSGQGEEEDEAREDDEHSKKINEGKPSVFCCGVTQQLEI